MITDHYSVRATTLRCGTTLVSIKFTDPMLAQRPRPPEFLLEWWHQDHLVSRRTEEMICSLVEVAA